MPHRWWLTVDSLESESSESIAVEFRSFDPRQHLSGIRTRVFGLKGPIVLNIVILHCHFEKGGVTQVVENHLHALVEQKAIERLVLVSGHRDGGLSQSTRNVTEHLKMDGLDYDEQRWNQTETQMRIHDLGQQLDQELRRIGLLPDSTVLHWHNHGLGKNAAAPGIVAYLAKQHWRILLQIHDFAEDNRPDNYDRLLTAIGADNKASVDRYLYPVAAQIQYCTLTSVDAELLIELGIPHDRVCCLPNSVVQPFADSTIQHDSEDSANHLRKCLRLPRQARWCLYPVRGIRRKNVGELLLISQLTDEEWFFGLTLCPATPVERRSYERWRQVAKDVAPRVVFDAGQHAELSFVDNLLASECVVSTSVAEGFGMAFLEPWLMGREVIARRLGNVTGDFEANGMRFPKFYDSIPIPGDQAWVEQCRKQFADAAQKAWQQLPSRLRPSVRVPRCESDTIDFARLVPREQVNVLSRISHDRGYRNEVMERSANLVQQVQAGNHPLTLDHNANVVRENYSLGQNRERLTAVYQQLLAAIPDGEVSAPRHAGIVLDSINRTRPFYPCRTEEVIDERF